MTQQESIAQRFSALVADASDHPLPIIDVNAIAESVYLWQTTRARDENNVREFPSDLTAANLLSALTGPHASYISDPEVYRYAVAWAAYEIDLWSCPARTGDRMVVLCNRPAGAALNQGGEVVVLDNNRGGGAVRFEEWSTWRHQVIMLTTTAPDISEAPEDYHSSLTVLVEWLNGDLDTRKPPPWSSLDQTAASLQQVGHWGWGEWCTTDEGKEWLGRASRYYRNRFVLQWVAANTETPVEVVVEEDSGQTESVGTMTTEQLLARIAELEEARQNDAAVISEVLMREATDRRWCSEYDGIVTEINERLDGTRLHQRPRDVSVQANGWIRVPFHYNFTVSVPRDSDLTAVELAPEAWDNSRNSAYRLVSGGYVDSGLAEFEAETTEFSA